MRREGSNKQLTKIAADDGRVRPSSDGWPGNEDAGRPPGRGEGPRGEAGISDGERAFRALLALMPEGSYPASQAQAQSERQTRAQTETQTRAQTRAQTQGRTGAQTQGRARAEAGTGIGVDESGNATTVPADDPRCMLVRDDGGWRVADRAPAESRAVLDLYLPVRCHSGAMTVAHLGQSLDGQIATASGDSFYVTGAANLLHLQRMRALCDAVVVGAGTVAADDPRLTVRLAAGGQPVRVVLDPRRRLRADRRVFSDDAAPTLLIADEALADDGERHGQAEVVGIAARDGRLVLAALLDELHRRVLRTVFVEGGGTTVSRFLEAKQLDRLQIAVAPLVIGCGRPGLHLPGQVRIGDCLRMAHRVFRMGDDVLIDCDLRRPPSGRPSGDEVVRVL